MLSRLYALRNPLVYALRLSLQVKLATLKAVVDRTEQNCESGSHGQLLVERTFCCYCWLVIFINRNVREQPFVVRQSTGMTFRGPTRRQWCDIVLEIHDTVLEDEYVLGSRTRTILVHLKYFSILFHKQTWLRINKSLWQNWLR